MRRFIFIPLLLVTTAAWCDPSQIKQVALSLNAAATANDTLQDQVIAAEVAGDLSKEKMDSIVEITRKVAVGIQTSNELTRQFAQMPEGGPDQLLDLLVPIIEVLETEVAEDRLNLIPDDGVRGKVSFGLNTVLTAMRTAQVLLGGPTTEEAP